MNKAFTVKHVFQDAAEEAGNGSVMDVTGLARLGIQVSYSAADSASASPSGSVSASPSGSASPSASASRSPSASTSRSPSASASPSGSASPSASPSAPPSGVSGNVHFEASISGDEWYELPVTPINSGTDVTMTSAPGLWTVTASGLALVRCRLGGTVLGAVTVMGVGTVAAS